MTLEKRCPIEPSDFLALTFECGACGTAFRLPVRAIPEDGFERLLARNCSHCGEPTGVGTGTAEYAQYVNFCIGLRRLAEAAKGRNLKLKMELKCADLEAKP